MKVVNWATVPFPFGDTITAPGEAICPEAYPEAAEALRKWLESHGVVRIENAVNVFRDGDGGKWMRLEDVIGFFQGLDRAHPKC